MFHPYPWKILMDSRKRGRKVVLTAGEADQIFLLSYERSLDFHPETMSLRNHAVLEISILPPGLIFLGLTVHLHLLMNIRT